MNILIVEDEQPLAQFILRTLEADSHRCDVANDGRRAIDLASSDRYDLVLLDLGLPAFDGMDVLGAIRKSCPDVAVLVVTGRAQLEERVRCLNMGADDCLLKPFALSELRARVGALQRRRGFALCTVLRYGDLELNRLTRGVYRAGKPLDLTAKEFALLECLMRHRGEVVSRTILLKEVWQMQEGAETNVVDVYINYLRRKLDQGFATPAIQTRRGEGYRLTADADSSIQQGSSIANVVHPVVSAA